MSCIVQILIHGILIVSHLIHQLYCAPLPVTQVSSAEIVKFLRYYGYLDSRTSESESLYHEDAIIEGIKTVQRYGGLYPSGVVDQNTVNLMKSPRCGVTDIYNSPVRRKRFVLGPSAWRKRTITYNIVNWSPKVGEENVDQFMREAFRVWAPYGDLKFKQVNSVKADITIAFGARHHGDNYPFDGPGRILAHAFYPYEEDSYGGDIHFDNDENWVENATDLQYGVDFLSVAVHELGHSLGLAHSPVYSSIMFPYYKGPGKSTVISYDDIMAMYELYIRNTVPLLDVTENPIEEEVTPETDNKNEDEKVVTRTFTPPFDTSTKHTPTFHGDYETIDSYRNRHNITTPSPTISSTKKANGTESIPNICEGYFDAVTSLRGEVFVFKGQYVWRLTNDFYIRMQYPMKFKNLLKFPDEVDHIDAVYERPDGFILFFIGNSYWEYNGNSFTRDSPKPISDFGINKSIDHIDAVFIWEKNHRTYLMSGNQIWRYNEQNKNLDDNYPMSINRWRGIPANIDSAVTLSNGLTYFFKNNSYWLYDNDNIQPKSGYPKTASVDWMHC